MIFQVIANVVGTSPEYHQCLVVVVARSQITHFTPTEIQRSPFVHFCTRCNVSIAVMEIEKKIQTRKVAERTMSQKSGKSQKTKDLPNPLAIPKRRFHFEAIVLNTPSAYLLRLVEVYTLRGYIQKSLPSRGSRIATALNYLLFFSLVSLDINTR